MNIPVLLTSTFHQALASLPASLLASALQPAASPPARIQRCPYMLHTLKKERQCLRESQHCCCGHCLQGRRMGHLSGGCNSFSSVYGEISTSDSSASEPRWLPILELRREKFLGPEHNLTRWTTFWQSQNSHLLRLTLNPGPLNLDLQPLRRDTEQGPGVASPVGSGRFLGLQDCWFPHAGISVTNKCLKYKPHLDTRVWNRIRETIRTWKRQAQTLRKPVSLGTVELWAKCIYTEPGTAVRALSDLLSIHYNLNKSYYYSTTRTEEETKTKKGSQQGCEPRKPGPESTSFTLCCGDLPPGGSPGETFLLHQPPNVFPRILWLLQGAV